MRTKSMLLISLTFVLWPSANAQTTKQAETFVRGLYKQYDVPFEKLPDLTRKQSGLVLSPSLIELIRRDRQRTPESDEAKIDEADIFCSCQYLDHLKIKQLHITQTSATTATASVILQVFFNQPNTTTLQLRLVWLTQGWRVDDISTKPAPSLRHLISAK